MKLNLIEEFLLIALDDDKGVFLAEDNHLNFGIAGALLLEMTLEGKLEMTNGKLKPIGNPDSFDQVINDTLISIKMEREEQRLGYWLGIFRENGKSIKVRTLKELISKGILRKEKGKILWVIPYTKYPTENPVPENKVRARIDEVVIRGAKATPRDIMLLSLIEVCSLTEEAFRHLPDVSAARSTIHRLSEIYEKPSKIEDPHLKLEASIISATRAAVVDPTADMKY